MLKYEFSRKTKNIFRIIAIILILFVAVYLSGLITQVIMLLFNGAKTSITFNPISCITYAFDFKHSMYAWIGEGILLLLLFAYSVSMSDKRGVLGDSEKDRSQNFEYAGKDNYGSARQMSEKDIRLKCKVVSVNKYNDTKGDIILGYLNNKEREYVLFPENSIQKGISYNRNIAVCGGPGSRKTRTFVVNYIFQAIQRGESIIVSDTKGEIYGFTKRYAEKKGYVVKILNLVEQGCSDGWDVLAEVKNNPEMATQLASVIIQNTGGEKGDQFWNDAEQNCLKAVTLLKSVGTADISNTSGKQSTMGDVYKFIATTSLNDMDATFQFIDDNLPRHPALVPFKQFRNAGDDVCKKILHGLGNRLQLFQDEQLCNVLGTKDIDFELAGKKKVIYYLRFSDQQSTYQFITSLFFSFMFIKLVALADRQTSRELPVPVNLLLDEFCNLGTIPDFTYKISTVRSRRINIAIIFQNIPQLQNRYPEGAWEEIISDCDTFIFLGCGNESTTPNFVSELTGEATINVGSNSLLVGENQLRATSSTGRRMVMTPNQVKTLSPDTLLVFIKDMQVMRLIKMDFSKHPAYNDIEIENVSEHRGSVEKVDIDYSSYIIDSVRQNDYMESYNQRNSSDEDDDESRHSYEPKPQGNKKSGRKKVNKPTIL